MSDYIPGWQFSFPEPHGSDERAHRSTGPRREPPACCYNCGEDIDEQPVISPDRHTFCSRQCLDAWVRR